MKIKWTRCADAMPPYDVSEIILKCYGVLTHTNGITAHNVWLNPYAGHTTWTPYRPEIWEELNK